MDSDRLATLRSAWRRSVGIVVVLAMLLIAGAASAAPADDFYVVHNIRVDETAETAAAAREKALAQGERQAWDALLDRLVDPQQKRPLPEYAARDVGDAVRDFWVSDEKTSPVRYIATLNYTFRPDRVRRLLSSRNLRFTAAPSPPVVVVPVLEAANGRRLWDEPNPWKHAWEKLPPSIYVPLKVPAGTIADLTSVNAEEALTRDLTRLTDLIQRYDAAEALVTLAAVQPGAEPNTRQLRVTSWRVASGGTRPLGERSFPVSDAEPSPAVLAEAAQAVFADMVAAWRRSGSIVEVKPSVVAVVSAPTGSLNEWIDLRQKLEAVPDMTRVRVIAMSRERARLQLVFAGDNERLLAALAQVGLGMQQQNGAWVLSRGAVAIGAGEGAVR